MIRRPYAASSTSSAAALTESGNAVHGLTATLALVNGLRVMRETHEAAAA
ncbi:hypothetical protein K7472_02230 [Streptomyces sp. PTM05]|uniref:Uncharacterized protein n=1 Tax=Streptantibioticus parmotrematis TaxID=2873249 RepID=A0ABS7QKF8_9ACTN|nr:hypothetical protein [Streptantibioticus parmotrematis]MBY8883663.1 hypothetical protein [Streptantibioticus parmotrematis]